jgi:hypothetical protein
MRRKRSVYFLLILLVTGVGLLWRSSIPHFSPFMSKYGGDALWALLVFCGFGFFFNRLPTLRLSLVSFAFAWTIEFLQLYHAPWIDSIRAARLGHLVLGSTFNWPDLVAYMVGIAIGVLLEMRCGITSASPDSGTG